MTMRTKPGVPKRYEKVAFLSLFFVIFGVSTLIFLGLFQVMKRQTLGPWDDPFWKFPPHLYGTNRNQIFTICCLYGKKGEVFFHLLFLGKRIYFPIFLFGGGGFNRFFCSFFSFEG